MTTDDVLEALAHGTAPGGDVEAVLLSTSCTTGWRHWGHGWLLVVDDAVVRIADPRLTRLAASGQWVQPQVPLRGRFSPDDVAPLLAPGRGRLVVRRPDVVSARLRGGLVTSRLAMRLADGRRVKLLWMRDTSAVAELRRVLSQALPA